MGLFGPPDIDKLKTKRDFKGLQSALKYRQSARVRKDAALAVAELAAAIPTSFVEPILAGLIALLNDPESPVVNAAVRALCKIGQPALLPLLSALHTGGDKVREAAAFCVGRILTGQPDPTYLNIAIDPLTGLLRDPRPEVRKSAAAALGRALPGLEPARRLLPVESLTLAARDPAGEVREAAAVALGRSGDSRAIRPLISILTDISLQTRKVAAEGLEQLGWAPTSLDETIQYRAALRDWDALAEVGAAAIEGLSAAIESPDAPDQVLAVQALGRIQDARIVPPLVAALKSPAEAIRTAAAAALEQTALPAAADGLLHALRDPDKQVRKSVALALAHTGDERAVQPLLALLRSREPDLAETAALALAGLREKPVQALLNQLAEVDPVFQERTQRVLIRIGAPAVAPLVDLLGESRPPLNRLAARILGEIGDARALWPLISALQNPELTLAAVQALGRLGDGRAAGPLLDLLEPAFSPAVRQAAALALGEIGEPLALDALILLLNAPDQPTRSEAARLLTKLSLAKNLSLGQKKKILDQRDAIQAQLAAGVSPQDQITRPIWRIPQPSREKNGGETDPPAA